MQRPLKAVLGFDSLVFRGPKTFRVTNGYWDRVPNQIKFIKKAEEILGIDDRAKWYNITVSNFQKLPSANAVLSRYDGSLAQALLAVYPDYPWKIWKFQGVPRDFWTHAANQRAFTDDLSHELNIQKFEDWYQVKHADFVEHGGASLVHRFDHSFINALVSIYPEYGWKIWKFSTVPRGFWINIDNCRRFLDEVSRTFNVNFFESKENWMKISAKDISDMGAAQLLAHHGSLLNVLALVYPDSFTSNPSKRRAFKSRTSISFWKDPNNRLSFFDKLAKSLNITANDQWGRANNRDVIANGGSLLLSMYDNSITKALQDTYPDIKFEEKNQSAPIQVAYRHWDDLENQRKFFDELSTQMAITNYDDWYRVTKSEVAQKGGSGILARYGDSLSKALAAVYPDHPWRPWRFTRAPKNYWNDPENRLSTLVDLETEMGVQKAEDWYEKSASELRQYGGGGLLEISGGMQMMLEESYPSFPWKPERFKSFEKSQATLLGLVRSIVGQDEIVKNNFTHPEMKFRETGKHMQLDVYVPKLALVLEFQGGQHYDHVAPFYLFGPSDSIQARDREKRRRCEELGMTLIDIPYWWDYRRESLAATIHSIRPDIVPEADVSKAIPSSPPSTRNLTRGSTLSKVTMEGFDWDEKTDLSGWIYAQMSPGFRVLWDGSTLWYRGKALENVPRGFRDALPMDCALDGYVEGIQDLSSNVDWSGAQLRIFDDPQKSQQVLEERLKTIQALVAKEGSNLKTFEYIEIENDDHARDVVRHVVKEGGRGIFVRKPNSHYIAGKSLALLILKDKHQLDALVVEIHENQLLCKAHDGSELLVPFRRGSDLPSKESVVNIGFSSIQEDGTLLEPHINKIYTRGMIKWNEILEDRYPYYLARGSRVGNSPKCRGCSRVIKDPNELRVRVQTTYEGPNTKGIVPMTATFCADPLCIISAHDQHTYFEPFDNKTVLVHSHLHVMRSELESIKGIKFVFTDPHKL